MNRHLINQYKLKFLYAIRPIYIHPITKIFIQHGLKPLRIEEVSTRKLNIIRPVLCNEVNCNKLALLEWYEEYFRNDWSLRNSMLWRVLENLYSKDISKPEVRKSFYEEDYYKMHVYLRSLGGHPREDHWIESKIISLIKLARSMERKGYDYSSLLDYIIVLKEPMCKSRYRIQHRIDGYEIYTGHHRAVCAAFLGIENLWAIVAQDIARYTPFGQRIDELVIDL